MRQNRLYIHWSSKSGLSDMDARHERWYWSRGQLNEKIIKRGRKNRFGNMIKTYACVFMVIDYIGLIFFPEAIIFRIVGRLSMPLFAYCIAWSFSHCRKRGMVDLVYKAHGCVRRRLANSVYAHDEKYQRKYRRDMAFIPAYSLFSRKTE